MDKVNFLIRKLITYPMNDKDVGFNSGIISVLKEELSVLNMNDTESKEFKIYQIFSASCAACQRENARAVLEKVNISKCMELSNFLINSEKLAAVKQLKEYSGLGLKEAKDIIDDFFQRLTW